MTSKSERTTQFILERVAPVFNRHGYAGTSMTQITEATGLTKGAVYGNFENKENLALKAFNYSIRKLNKVLARVMNEEKDPEGKLKAISKFYRSYRIYIQDWGGCPILNVSVDVNHQNVVLLERSREVIQKMKQRLSCIIRDGISQGQFRSNLDPERYASLMFAQIEGGIFLTATLNEDTHIQYMMDHLDRMIDQEMKK
jgi:AcrR family transcriptional regulator